MPLAEQWLIHMQINFHCVKHICQNNHITLRACGIANVSSLLLLFQSTLIPMPEDN